MESKIEHNKTGQVTGFACSWARADFEHTANQLNLNLTSDQIDNAMNDCFYGHNAEIGINWDVIECCLQNEAE